MFTILIAVATAAAQTAPDDPFGPDRIDVADAIECRVAAPDAARFVQAMETVAAKRGWKRVEGSNMMLVPYDLPEPITVAGTYRTRRIAFVSTGVLAVLDLPDPNLLSRALNIENMMAPPPDLNADKIIDEAIAGAVAAGEVTREEAEKHRDAMRAELEAPRFRKFLGRRVLSDVTDPSDGERWRMRTTISLNVSNVTDLPDKTLYGCAYDQQLLDKNGKPL